MIVWNYVGLDNYISPIYRFFEYSLGLWLRQWLCDREERKELFPGCNLLILVGVLILFHFGVGHWMNLFLLSGLIVLTYTFKSPILLKVLGNSFVLKLSKADIFIYLTHPGIGFHLVFFFICTNSIVATIGSVIVGYYLGKSFHFAKICINERPTK